MAHSPFDSSPLGTAILRAERVTYVNDAALRMIGRARDEVVGRTFATFIAPEDVPRLVERYQRRLRNEPVPSEYETGLLLADGTRLSVEVIASTDGEETIVQMRDIRARKERSDKLATLARTGAAVQAERSDDAVFRRVVDELRPAGFIVATFEPAGEALHFRPVGTTRMTGPLVGVLAGERPWTAFARRVWDEAVGYADDAALELARIVGGDEGERARRAAVEAGLLRAIAVRIDVGGVPTAILLLAASWLRQEDLPAIRLFGAQVSAALDAARAISDLSRRNRELAALNRLAALAGTAPDLKALFRDGTAEIAQAMDCAAVAVYLIDEPRRTAHLAHQHGGSPEAGRLFARIPIDDPASLLWKVVNSGQARVWSRLDYPEPARSVIARMGQETIVSVPLIARANVVGLMNIAYGTARQVGETELELFRAMGSHFAAAVETQHLLDDLRRRVDDLKLLHEVGRSLVATLDPREVIERGVSNLAKSVGAPVALLALQEPGKAGLTIKAVAGSEDGLRGQTLPLEPGGGTLASAAFQGRAPVMVREGGPGPSVEAPLRGIAGARVFLALPLVVRDRPIGAVVVVETGAREAFTPAEVERATAIANQLAVAVENARLYDDLRASYEALAQAQAQSVQKERLAALGELAAVVAHEVRNPLGVIFNSLVGCWCPAATRSCCWRSSARRRTG